MSVFMMGLSWNISLCDKALLSERICKIRSSTWSVRWSLIRSAQFSNWHLESFFLDGVLRKEWRLYRVKIMVILIPSPSYMSGSLHQAESCCLVIEKLSPAAGNIFKSWRSRGELEEEGRGSPSSLDPCLGVILQPRSELLGLRFSFKEDNILIEI